MDKGIRVAAVNDVEPGDALVLDTELTGTPDPISLFRDDDGTYYALDDTCSHEEASLADGWIEGCEVECPLHATRFSLRTGAPLCLPATRPVQPHAVHIDGEDVYLHVGQAPPA